MPDFERPIRDLEIYLSGSTEEKAYIQGRHDGMDQARKEIVLLLVIAVLAASLVCMFW